MTNPTQSDRSKHESDPEVSGNEVSELANSLVASQEAITVLGSTLADQVVGALQVQGIVPSQDQLVGGLPAKRTCGLPYHMMGRGFGGPIPAYAQTQQSGQIQHLQQDLVQTEQKISEAVQQSMIGVKNDLTKSFSDALLLQSKQFESNFLDLKNALMQTKRKTPSADANDMEP